MIKLFLRARHWQLFILIYGIPLFIQAVFMGLIAGRVITGTHIGQHPDLAGIFNLMIVALILTLPFTLIAYGWQWSVVHGLSRQLPAGVKLNLTRFRAFLIVPLIYSVIAGALGIYFFGMFADMDPATFEGEPPFHLFSGVFIAAAVLGPVHLFAMFCMFYCLYITGKTIKSVEIQREAEFADCFGEFILVWFFIIGVWILQPRINKLEQESAEDVQQIIL